MCKYGKLPWRLGGCYCREGQLARHVAFCADAKGGTSGFSGKFALNESPSSVCLASDGGDVGRTFDSRSILAKFSASQKISALT